MRLESLDVRQQTLGVVRVFGTGHGDQPTATPATHVAEHGVRVRLVSRKIGLLDLGVGGGGVILGVGGDQGFCWDWHVLLVGDCKICWTRFGVYEAVLCGNFSCRVTTFFADGLFDSDWMRIT